MSNDELEAVADEIIQGCSNWHDIQYVIKPRIVALLRANEDVFAPASENEMSFDHRPESTRAGV